jgi:tRNA 2-thiouridine synthesizing protein A
MAVTRLDLTGLKCPLPALMTRKAMKTVAIGECLEVRCTDPLAAIDIPALVQQSGDAMDASRHIDGVLIFTIRKTNAAIAHRD